LRARARDPQKQGLRTPVQSAHSTHVRRGTCEVWMVTEGGAPYGALLREARVRAGKSVAELARAVERTESHVRAVEDGTRSPMGVDETRRAAHAVGCDAAPLVEAFLRRRGEVTLDATESGPVFDLALWLALHWDLMTDEEAMRALDALRKVRGG